MRCIELRVLAWLMLVPVALGPVVLGQGRGDWKMDVRAGGWRLEIHGRRVVPSAARALSHAQTVRRWAPGAAKPEVLWEESSTGRAAAFLRSDGLCFLDPVRAKPRLVFPDGKVLEYPLGVSKTVAKEARGYDDLQAHQGGRVHFLGEWIVVARSTGTLTQIARFRVDVDAHTATGLETILEVPQRGMYGQANARAAMPGRAFLRLGNLLVWVNRGAGGRMLWNKLEDPWRSRRLRAYDFATRAFVEPAAIPDKVFLRHQARILEFIEAHTHNREPEFEMWAVPRFGRLGSINHMSRLIALFASAKGTMAEWEGAGALSQKVRPMRKVYLAALSALNER